MSGGNEKKRFFEIQKLRKQLFDEPDFIPIEQRHPLGANSIANKIKRDTQTVLDSKKHGEEDFLSAELRRVRDESLKSNLVRHTQQLKLTTDREEIEKEYRYNFSQKFSNKIVSDPSQ